MDSIRIKFKKHLLYFAFAMASLPPIPGAAQDTTAAREQEAVQSDSVQTKGDSLSIDSTRQNRGNLVENTQERDSLSTDSTLQSQSENIENIKGRDSRELESTQSMQERESNSEKISFFLYMTIGISLFLILLFMSVVLYQRKLWRREIQAMNEASVDAKMAFNEELEEKETEKADAIAKYEGRLKIYSELGDLALEDLQRAKKMLQMKQEEVFAENLSSNISMQGIQVKNLDYFENFAWKLNPKINVLLGRNGYGKSYLLRSLLSLLQNDDEKAAEIFTHLESNSRATILLVRDGEQEEIHYSKSGFQQSLGRIPVLAIPDARFVNKARAIVSIADDHNLKLPDSAAYHFLYQEPYEPIIQTFLYQLCIDYLDHEKHFDSPIFKLVQEVTEKLTGTKFTFHKIEVMGNARFRIEVLTEGNEGRPLPLQQISQGTISILAIFGLIHHYLSSLLPEKSKAGIHDKHAIIFIDEIDAHLHPIWQQQIINLLRAHFPNVQFILTAHNPLVVAGCLEGEVAVLRKEKDKKFSLKKFAHDFIGWQPEEIYRTIFEVEAIDENYIHYNTRYPFRKETQEKNDALEKKPNRSQAEEAELDSLREVLIYIERANHKQNERIEYSQFVRESKKRKRQLEKMKGKADIQQ